MKRIIDKCKCGVLFNANEHRDYYEDAETWLINNCHDQKEIDDIGKDVWEEMIKRDTILHIQFYPNTPVGFYSVYHYDYDELIKKALSILGGL